MTDLKHFAQLLLAAVLISACSGGDSGMTRVEQGNQQGILHLGNGTEPQGLDPHIVTGVPEHHIIQALFEGLVTKNPYTLEIEPGVAESWEISDDQLTYTFHLRDDARWSNGDPVSAEDFRWSWQRVLTPELGSQYNYMLFPVENAEAFAVGAVDDFNEVGVKVLDEHTLRVTLRAPAAYFLQLLDHYSTFPVHRATIEAFGSPTDRLTRWAREGNIVANGPFNLTEWQINSHIRVEKSDTYWGADQVELNGIVYYPTENLVTEERMFRDGQLHYTNDVPLEKISVYLNEEPELITIAPYLGTYYYMINTDREPFDDVRVRRALAMTVNRDLLVETVMQGIVEPSYAIVPPGTLGYQPPKTFDYDPQRARQLLADAGFPDGRDFPPFEILYNTSESHQKIAVAIQQMWQKELGISVTLTNQEWQVYLDAQNNMDYDVSRRGWIGDYVDPHSFLDMFITGGGNNKTGFASTRYDEIVLHEAPRKLDTDERFELYYQAENMLMEAMPIIPIYTYQTKHLVHPSVQGMPENIMDYSNFRYVYLEAEAQQ
ncbi:MAG: peptide ABC transporter substrate-binding protein [Pseudohongiellaceae bacterium]